MRVLIVNGHPRNNSFSESLVDSYVSGACDAGVHTDTITLYKICFDPNVRTISPNDQHLEPALREAQNLIARADHLVFIYPTWWGTMPALLKGFIDRTFTAGFAFKEIEGGTGYEGLLRGKSAQLITTMDTPYLVYRLLYRAPGDNAMSRATLGFCGIQMVRTLNFGPVKKSTVAQRLEWISKVRNEGFKLKNGVISPTWKVVAKMMIWLKALRLQFYPMTFVAYTMGAFTAAKLGYGFHSYFFWLGYLWLFFLEAATVLLNEYFDYSTDMKNRYFGPFTGGSRVLVDGLLTVKQIKAGITLTLTLSLVSLIVLLIGLNRPLSDSLPACAVLAILAIGYTVPPLKLSYRGLGELTVGATHSFAVIVCGYLFMGGGINEPFPWIIGLPLFLAVLPSIILAGITDYQADKEAGKRTFAVRFGPKKAARSALMLVWLSAATIVGFRLLGVLPETFAGVYLIAVPHALLLSFFLNQYIDQPAPPERIDGLLANSLIYLIWFGLIPLINLS